MIAVGHMSLVCSLALNLAFSGFLIYQLYFWWRKKTEMPQVFLGLYRVSNIVSLGLFFFVSLSFFILIYGFYQADYTFLLVSKYVSNQQPWYYRVSAVWGNHEGSMLLWVWLLALTQILFTGIIKKDSLQSFVSLGIASLVVCSFILYILSASDPFLAFIIPPVQGRGLTPLLQDPLLVIHPPILYFGYVLTLIPFSQATGFLITYTFLENKVEKEKAKKELLQILKWPVCIAWMFLTLGIMLGSYWAYYELGWGGYWFWDPVENASLLPWLALLALIHFRILADKQKNYYGSLLFTAILAFLLCILGTFLVRSGILSSVHAFAQSPERGLFILVLLMIWGAFSLGILAYKLPNLQERQLRKKMYLDSIFLLVGINCFLAILITTLWGTIYPLIMQVVFGQYISVGPLYFERLIGPFAFIGVAMLALIYTDLKSKMHKIKKISFYIILGGGLFIYMMAKGASFFQSASGGMGAVLITVMSLYCLEKPFSLRGVGIAIIHGAFGLFLIGASWDAAFQQVDTLTFKLYEKKSFHKYQLIFDKYKVTQGVNYQGVEVPLEVFRGSVYIGLLTPQWRLYKELGQDVQKTSQLVIQGISQLYVVIQSMQKGKVTVKVWYRPLINILWISGMMMILGLIFLIRRKKYDI